MAIPSYELANGVTMPQVMLGSFQMRSTSLMRDVVGASIELGAYGFDTSPSYKTEPMLGSALESIRNHGVEIPRGELFIQTKIDAVQMIASKGDVKPYVRSAQKKIGVDYLDSVAIHWPFPDYFVETYKTLQRLRDEGIIRAVGVCNVKRRHLETLDAAGCEQPSFIQNEIHPLNLDEETVAYAKSRGILVQAYSPLARMIDPIKNSQVLRDIAMAHKVSIVQVMLRWHLQRGLLPIVKTSNPARVKENFDVFGFELSQYEVEAINSMDRALKMFLESRCCPGC